MAHYLLWSPFSAIQSRIMLVVLGGSHLSDLLHFTKVTAVTPVATNRNWSVGYVKVRTRDVNPGSTVASYGISQMWPPYLHRRAGSDRAEMCGKTRLEVDTPPAGGIFHWQMFRRHCLFELSQLRHLHWKVVPAITRQLLFSTMLTQFSGQYCYSMLSRR